MTVLAPRVLLDFAAPQSGGAERCRLAFGEPRKVLRAQALGEVREVLAQVEAEARQGCWCVGMMAYEAAPAFDVALTVHAAAHDLAWFGVFDAPEPWPSASPAAGQEAPVQAVWQAGPDRAAFDAAFDRIQAAIAAGDLYQVNHTAALQGELVQGHPLALFQALHRAQPGGYAAYLDAGDWQCLSVSPELFFDWQPDGRLLVRPMKGTAARQPDPVADREAAQALRASDKERAENVMIVDLIRNDVSRVAQPFSVQVPRLFQVEALPTVWQMTSDVVARTRNGVGLADVFAALFPCGSVTGAPKVQAMRQIAQLEPTPRGVYCGAIGVVRPDGGATFNVAIRTVVAQGHALTCGIGSGITAGAQADGEWQEWRHKRAFLERASQAFEVLETLALEQGRLRHVEHHVARMAQAARHFAYPWSTERVQAVLGDVAQRHPTGLWRVRLLLSAAGEVTGQAFAMEPSSALVTLRLAERPFLAADSEFVRYKTTRRAHYDAAAPGEAGVFDTLLWNERGELTECTRGNIAVHLDGRWVTPPLACGLLNGVGREVALREGRLQEAVVRVSDLPRATAVAFVNSLRGWIDARLL